MMIQHFDWLVKESEVDARDFPGVVARLRAELG